MREGTDPATAAAMLAEVCDAVVSWDSAVTPPAHGAFIAADTDVSAPITTLALGIRHVLGAHSLRGAAVSTRGCSPAIQHSLTELAEPFGLTLHVDDTHPRPDLLEKLGSPATVSLDPLDADDAIDTSEPSLTLQVATWCALVEVLSS
ncbi:hypothetical protein [Bowdeniella nasicola]|nr:hypothetical protein [Bowdeniella nasicola]